MKTLHILLLLPVNIHYTGVNSTHKTWIYCTDEALDRDNIFQQVRPALPFSCVDAVDGWSRAAKIQHWCRCVVALSTLEAASVLLAVMFLGQTDADVVLVALHCTSRALIF